MSVGIAWLLRQPQLDLALRAGPAGDRVRIDVVQPTELQDPRPWLSGGELVLTTGLALVEQDDCGDYVRRLAEVGVAAIGFGTGLSHARIPGAMLTAADDLGLPVLEVPYTTPFAAVSRAVNTRLAEQEYELVRQAADTQVRITRAALKGGVPSIVRELAVATTTAVAFVDARPDEFVAHPPAAADITRHVAELGKRRTASVTTSSPGRTVIVQPVGHSGVVSGHLVVEAHRALVGVELVLIGHAVSLVALELAKSSKLRDERNTLGSKLFGLLLDGTLQPEESHECLLDAVGNRGRVRVLYVKTPRPTETRAAMNRALEMRQRPFYSLGVDDTFTVLMRGDDTVADVAELLVGMPDGVRAGLSAPHRLDDVCRAVEQARHALAASRAGDQLTEFDAGLGTTLLRSPPVRSMLAFVAASTIKVLAEHDRENGTQLVPSLRSFLEANGQWEASAAALKVHRHTLRGRIRKAEEILGVDLGDARLRAELLLALLVES
ncbi:PucR family transcriptional regulator [Nocardia cyriacigeorgica]|uniref:PucR family transcriptional regulator n=1 Tax=Nocardia cyriacigeorgica TaxID=135487 RepID=A0A6P1D837_9NOCA|nr:PucR family transcriptional regulator [Nocardia cyriacigeorgica]NEW45691.1 PucR family transcriptional regulator [Nocardia cyriacigeorgica]